MPELPEVQSTVDYLKERILGERISRVRVLWPRTLAATKPLRKPDSLVSLLRTATVQNVTRRGKFIVVSLATAPSNASMYVLFHLRMSGSIEVVHNNPPIAPHDRAIISFESGSQLRFNDIRKFGRMYVVEDPLQITAKLGIEPLHESFTNEYLYEMLQARKGVVKSLLLRQDLISGIGNIYADEVLWYAGIHPLTPANKVSLPKSALLVQGIREILKEAISLAGTDYGDGVVEGGMYSPRVYGREGAPCVRCQQKITRIVVGQRGTHFCPLCQKKTR